MQHRFRPTPQRLGVRSAFRPTSACRAFSVAVGLLVFAACDESGPRAADPPPSAELVSTEARVHQLGEVARHPLFELRVLNTKTCSVEPHFQPPPGVQKLGVELELRGLGDVQVPVNPFYAEIRDRDGRRFEATLAGCTPVLGATRVQGGESARGWVTFDVPDTLRGASFSYAPAIIGMQKPELVFSLQP